MDTKQTVKTEVVIKGETLIKSVIEKLINKNYSECLSEVVSVQKLFQQEQSHENISICLSLIGLVEYLIDKNKYLKALTYINDGAYLADFTGNLNAKLINEFALATVDLAEKNFDTANSHYKKSC